MIEHHASIDDVVGAALWLAEQLGIDENERRAMGYRDGETLTPFAKVKQAAGKLKPGDIDGAKDVLDQLVAIENRTPATDDIIVGLVKEKLGPPVTLKSLRAILKGAKRQAAKAELDRDANEAGKSGPPRGFRESKGWMRQQVETEAGSEWAPICTSLTVTAMLRDNTSTDWGLMVHFEDADRRPHDVPLPADVYGDPNSARGAPDVGRVEARRRLAQDPRRAEHAYDEMVAPGPPHGRGDPRLDARPQGLRPGRRADNRRSDRRARARAPGRCAGTRRARRPRRMEDFGRETVPRQPRAADERVDRPFGSAARSVEH